MRNKILLVVGVAFVAYVFGSRTATVQIDKGESVGHQLVRMWNDPKVRKQRRKTAERAAKKAKKALGR
ncbi:hypothetical protein [Microbacterium sp. 2RAF4]|uniref:hypothetical protein n=1 Tax=Microbacterium sp. 2RAF4 TaxID=3232999 RepID=UPI003F98B8E3